MTPYKSKVVQRLPLPQVYQTQRPAVRFSRAGSGGKMLLMEGTRGSWCGTLSGPGWGLWCGASSDPGWSSWCGASSGLGGPDLRAAVSPGLHCLWT